jgi:hypothetical protein
MCPYYSVAITVPEEENPIKEGFLQNRLTIYIVGQAQISQIKNSW